MKKLLVTLAAALTLCVLAAGFYFSPHLALRSMKQAARAGDADALAEYVDFEAVRGSLKAALRKSMQERTAGASPLAALGGALAERLFDPVVDLMVTPRGLTLLLSGRKPGEDRGQVPSDEQVDGAASVETSYASLDEFVARVTPRLAPDTHFDFVLRREGLIGWKLVEIRLP